MGRISFLRLNCSFVFVQRLMSFNDANIHTVMTFLALSVRKIDTFEVFLLTRWCFGDNSSFEGCYFIALVWYLLWNSKTFDFWLILSLRIWLRNFTYVFWILRTFLTSNRQSLKMRPFRHNIQQIFIHYFPILFSSF